MQEPHGGNIHRAARELGLPEQRILDFSASINPLGVPRTAAAEIRKGIRSLPHYPDPDARRLTSRIARQYGIDAGSIICGNGSTELIYLVARALKPESVVIPAPTFQEYERAVLLQFRSKKITLKHPLLKPSNSFDVNAEQLIHAMQGCSMVFLCNPNNPTGRLIKKSTLLGIADAARELGCYLVVDEAFIDFTPKESVIKEVARNPFLIVLRSLTKFYALSGLRLGFAAAPPPVAELLRRHKEPWTVNSLAQRAGSAALDDKHYRKESLAFIKEEKTFMEREFRRLGIDYVPSAANYYLLRLDAAQDIIAGLRSKGILVRNCVNFTGLDETYMRVAVKTSRDNRRLIKELERLCRVS
ncbi:MAG: threonine-phosphate decarboxylase CobD [Nitrospirota bacterium]